jgi:biopolymer transport protein ExbB
VWEIIEAAGWPIWPLIITSIVGFAIVIERAWSLRESFIIPRDLIDNVHKMISKGNIRKDEIQSLQKHSMLGEIYATVLKNQGKPSDIIKTAVEQTGESVSYRLEKYLGVLGTISTVAPLLGLFGTIIGMVELFSSFTSSGHDVAIFARGISIALYNTAGGIVVAVPAMIAYRFYRSKVDHFINEMEMNALDLIETLQGNS